MSQTMNSRPRLTTSAMIASIAAEGQATRPAPFGHALVKVAEKRPDVIGMTADLAKYTDLHIFGKEYPERFFQMGMAEQLLIAAAGEIGRASCRQRVELTVDGVGRRRSQERSHGQ